MTVKTLIEVLSFYNKNYNVQIISDSKSDFKENVECVTEDKSVDTVYIITE